MKTPTFFSVVDSKNGKVWINDPRSDKVELVADIKLDINHYLKWVDIIGKIRDSSPKQIANMVKIIESILKNLKTK